MRKWIDPDGATAERIQQQVARCPSGALVFLENQQEK
jgi:putative redox protein